MHFSAHNMRMVKIRANIHLVFSILFYLGTLFLSYSALKCVYVKLSVFL